MKRANQWFLLVMCFALAGCDAADELLSVQAFNEGVKYYEAGVFDKAVAAYTRSIQHSPDDYAAYIGRACAYDMLDEFDSAMADYAHAIQLIGTTDTEILAETYFNRGITYHRHGRLAEAQADYKATIRLERSALDVHGLLARIQCTSPDRNLRDGEEALRNATVACDRDDWENWTNLDTLAAAYAELGRFDEAVKWGEKARAVAPEETRPGCDARLLRYRRGEPHREARLDLFD